MLTSSTIVQVLACYDLGKILNVRSSTSGFVNETAFVQTSSGCFVVRRNHRRTNEETLCYRHELITWLDKHDFPTPPLIPTRAGDTLLELDGRFYEVMPCIHGKDYDSGRPQQLVSAGATLAEYHLAIHGFPPPEEPAVPRYSPQEILALTEVLIQRDIMGDLEQELKWYDVRASQLRALLFDTHYFQLPHTVIHGDIHRENLLFFNDQVVALLDFDQVTWDARIVDIADALVAFATGKGHQHLAWGVFQGPLDEQLAQEFLAAYHSISPLSHMEIELLPTVVELLWLQGELGRVVSTPEGAADYHQSVLDQGRWLSEWMTTHRERLIHSWQALNGGSISRITASAA